MGNILSWITGQTLTIPGIAGSPLPYPSLYIVSPESSLG
jgi:hypothetical protein